MALKGDGVQALESKVLTHFAFSGVRIVAGWLYIFIFDRGCIKQSFERWNSNKLMIHGNRLFYIFLEMSGDIGFSVGQYRDHFFNYHKIRNSQVPPHIPESSAFFYVSFVHNI